MKYFFAGILGSGMASLASMLYDSGNEVMGCDDAKTYSFTQEELDKRGIPVFHDAEKLTSSMIFVYTSAINENHYAYKKAKELGCHMYEYFEMLGELTRYYQNTISISGTHGKTTTTAMLSHILDSTIGANYLIGDGTGHIHEGSDNFVVESCEFKKHFLKYTPNYSIITNIFYDHVDCYKDINEVLDAFQQFVNNTKTKVVACGDNENVRKLLGKNIIYYGFEKHNDIRAEIKELREDGSIFDVYLHGNFFGSFNINIYGEHMILNATACIYLSHILGLSIDEITTYLNNFEGAKRRFSEQYINDVVIVDDYAHHPNEVRTVLNTARQKYPDKELVPVLIPYTISRTEAFYKEFADVLKEADKVYVTDIEPARESFDDFPGITSDLIIDLIPNAEHISSETINNCQEYINIIKRHTNRLVAIVQDLLLLSEMESSDLPLVKTETNIKQLIYHNILLYNYS